IGHEANVQSAAKVQNRRLRSQTKMRRILIIAAAVAALAVNAFAALSPKYTDWAKGPAQFIMTKDEQAKWKTINDDADAQAFIDLFWARRDPTPDTPFNE